MALSFTRAALLDKQLEDVSIVLENRLVGTRFWLPSRQEIEIRRTGTWLDYPVRGIIRGRWEIGDYQINQGVPYNIFGGPKSCRRRQYEQQRHVWTTPRVLDSLPPDVRAVTDADVRRVQEEARSLVRARALQRARTLALSARGVSDFARVDRVEGLALGGGLTQRLGRRCERRRTRALRHRRRKRQMAGTSRMAERLGRFAFGRSVCATSASSGRSPNARAR